MSKHNHRRHGAALGALLLAGTALSGAAGWLAVPAFAEGQAAANAGVPAVAAPQVSLPGFGDLVARVRPAVVTITATERQQAEQASSPFPQGSEQDQMFRRYFGQRGGRGEARQAQALGSGFIVDAQGHVVTNNHVIDGASQVKVTLDDGRELSARIVGRDPRTDLALLKVDAPSPLPFLNLGNSDAARPGDWVVAVGNPFGLGGTVTAGIVSARGRDIHSGPYDDFLQIDAPINRGNSGGPLFSLDGSVIGVNTAIFSPSGGSVGIGFAIPSNLVSSVVSQLKENGRVDRGFIGASTQPVDATMARALRLPKPEGALVAQVEPNSPAARAGLQPGDVVTALGETTVRNPRDLARAVGGLRSGAETTLTARRDGRETQLTVKLAALPDQGATGKEQPAEAAPRGQLGIALTTTEEAAKGGLELPRGTRGAVIAEVRPDSPAAEAGLRQADVITSVGGKAVDGPEQAISAIREAVRANDGAVALQVIREGRRAFVAVQAAAPGRNAATQQG
ncbi:Do family serine endopeptidase [Roseomonas sp. SSH11]|uniref:Probable periplasmic serine endoprotease DegP-like n=1 Tax=Pararoseomonas baculiformis TaxID=2820812 RepID=A0ABS4AA01_9PROT|nr:Do family serine endopeptidase [Pararoseomonas baculiformis]MBP0443819.1 Do family serine endopeptidase [Pararoseomonas baculiformis]